MIKRIIFDGRVQGVGFRATTHAIARHHSITGFVRNQRDGTVELVARGTPVSIEGFVADIESAMEGHIDRREETDSPDEHFHAFEIRH